MVRRLPRARVSVEFARAGLQQQQRPGGRWAPCLARRPSRPIVFVVGCASTRRGRQWGPAHSNARGAGANTEAGACQTEADVCACVGGWGWGVKGNTHDAIDRRSSSSQFCPGPRSSAELTQSSAGVGSSSPPCDVIVPVLCEPAEAKSLRGGCRGCACALSMPRGVPCAAAACCEVGVTAAAPCAALGRRGGMGACAAWAPLVSAGPVSGAADGWCPVKGSTGAGAGGNWVSLTHASVSSEYTEPWRGRCCAPVVGVALLSPMLTGPRSGGSRRSAGE